MKENNILKLFSLSDLHLGNSLGLTDLFLKNLDSNVLKNKKISGLDMIILAGDIFDQLLPLNSVDVPKIQLFFTRLLWISLKHNIAIRVMEGTPSHDRKQSEQFIALKQIIQEFLPENNGLDIQYITDLSIVYEPKFNINILYVPDEWRADNEQTKQEVRNLLQNHNLSQVDITVIHGTFPYQLPPIAHIPVHDEFFYSSITRHYVLAGHIHIPSKTNNILVNGSHDRMSHNEEMNKGLWHITCHLNNPKLNTACFEINKTAARFKSFDLNGLTVEEAHTVIMEYIKPKYEYVNAHNPLFIRLVFSKDDNHTELYLAFKKSFPMIKWSNKITKIKKDSDQTIVALHQFTPNLKVNHNSITSIIKQKLSKLNLEPVLIDYSLAELESVKKEVA